MQIKDLILHLRLHWQIMLAPLFFWGYLLAVATTVGSDTPLAAPVFGVRFWFVFLIFHVFFYGGATALNSYYDQDEGPVGGLWEPPVVTRDLWVFAVGIQLAGLAVLPFISLPLFVLALIMGIIGTAYSHPAVRLKARPWTSLLAVSVFQGMGGTAAGWLLATDDAQTLLSTTALLGMLAAALIITGFYPLTQIYQRAQDRKVGVISFAVHMGERCFPIAIACMVAAAALMGYLAWHAFGPWEAAAAAVGVLVLAVYIGVWWQRYDDAAVRTNYEWMMRLGYLMTAGFLGFVGWLLVVGV